MGGMSVGKNILILIHLAQKGFFIFQLKRKSVDDCLHLFQFITHFIITFAYKIFVSY